MAITIPIDYFGERRYQYALSSRDVALRCFRQVFAELGFRPQKSDEAEIAYYPNRGERISSKIVSLFLLSGKIEPDEYSVKFFSTGNPHVTALEVFVRLKFHKWNKDRQHGAFSAFWGKLALVAAEYKITFVDYSKWNDYVTTNPIYSCKPQWTYSKPRDPRYPFSDDVLKTMEKLFCDSPAKPPPEKKDPSA